VQLVVRFPLQSQLGKQEWQQVLEQPDLILGYGDWGLAVELPPTHNPNFTQWIMIPTGGSSGQIRFAIHTWETLMASVRGFQQYFQLNQVNSFCVLPLYHVSGLMQFLRSFTTGGSLLFCHSRIEMVKGVILASYFFISLVPTQLRFLESSANQLAIPI